MCIKLTQVITSFYAIHLFQWLSFGRMAGVCWDFATMLGIFLNEKLNKKKKRVFEPESVPLFFLLCGDDR